MNARALIALLLLICTARISVAEGQLQYGPSIVQITGVLHIEPRPKDPDDSDLQKTIKHITVLRLDAPITVIGKNDNSEDETYEHVMRIQLAYSPPVRLKRYAGRRLTLEGTLFGHITAHHYTKVLMDVGRVVAIDEKKPPSGRKGAQ